MSVDFPEHTSLLELESSVLADIHEFGDCAGDAQKQSQKLETLIQGKMSQIRALTRDLELLVEELDSEEECELVARLLTAHASQYSTIQKAFKAAALQRRHQAVKQADSERQQLLGSPEAATRRRQMATDADVVGASEGITESLRRTRQMMSEELEHTSTTLAAMDASHSQLGKTRDQYVGQHGLLKKSKGLLGTLNWQQRSETILLWFGLALFALTAAYVAQKRIIYFVPEAVRPMQVMRTTAALVKGGGAEAGIDTSKGLRRTPTPMPAVPSPPDVITHKEEEKPPIAVAVPEEKRPENVAVPTEKPSSVAGEMSPPPKEVLIETPSKAVEEPKKVPEPVVLTPAVPRGPRAKAASGKRAQGGANGAPAGPGAKVAQAARAKMAAGGKAAPGAKGKFAPRGKGNGAGGVNPSAKRGGGAGGAQQQQGLPAGIRPPAPGGKTRQGPNGAVRRVNGGAPGAKKENVAPNVKNEL